MDNSGDSISILIFWLLLEIGILSPKGPLAYGSIAEVDVNVRAVGGSIEGGIKTVNHDTGVKVYARGDLSDIFGLRGKASFEVSIDTKQVHCYYDRAAKDVREECGMLVRLIRRYAVLLLVGTLWGTQVNAIDASFCEEKFGDIAFANGRYPTIDDKVSAFEELKKRCSGTGIYEFHLANLEMRAGRLESAEKALKYGLSLNTPYDKELKAGLADIDIKRGDLTAAEHAYAELATTYPDWYIPPQNLGLIKIDQGMFDKAIQYLLAANKIEKNAFTYQNLAVAYNVTEQHELAVQAMNDAFALSKQAATDVDAMLATAMSYGWLNKFDVADGVLRMLMDARPGIEHSAKFRKALRFLKTQQENSESQSRVSSF